MVNNMQVLGDRMMTVAQTYPNDKIANEFARVGDLLVHQGLPYVKPLTDLDKMVVKFFHKVSNAY